MPSEQVKSGTDITPAPPLDTYEKWRNYETQQYEKIEKEYSKYYLENYRLSAMV